jgi:hypothetical protein
MGGPEADSDDRRQWVDSALSLTTVGKTLPYGI